MRSNLSIRVFAPSASTGRDRQATVWLLGGDPPFTLDPQPSPGLDVQTAGTGRTWCLRIRGQGSGAIALIARDFGGACATATIDLTDGAADRGAAPAAADRPA